MLYSIDDIYVNDVYVMFRFKVIEWQVQFGIPSMSKLSVLNMESLSNSLELLTEDNSEISYTVVVYAFMENFQT